MAYKKQKGGPKMYRKDGALPMKSPMKNINNMKEYSKSGDAVQFGDAPTDMKSPNEMKSSGFKMKSGSPMKRNFGIGSTPSPMKNLETYGVDFTKFNRDGRGVASSSEDLIKQYQEALASRGKNQADLEAFQKKYPTAASYAGSLDYDENKMENIQGDVARRTGDNDEDKQLTYQQGSKNLMKAIQEGTIDKSNLTDYIQQGFTGDDREAVLNELQSTGIVSEDEITNIRSNFEEQDSDAVTADEKYNLEPSTVDAENSKEVQKTTVMNALKRQNKEASASDLEKMYAEYLEDLKTKSAGGDLDTFDQDRLENIRRSSSDKETGFRKDVLRGGGLDIDKDLKTI
jgi:hypothetical protein|tara:strand:- start:154 stop:1185 length:1032 start_codon:yes stop_codon:yes gene_type:complete